MDDDVHLCSPLFRFGDNHGDNQPHKGIVLFTAEGAPAHSCDSNIFCKRFTRESAPALLRDFKIFCKKLLFNFNLKTHHIVIPCAHSLEFRIDALRTEMHHNRN
jgi:hypothetical protein